jgi:hypothetical protein
MLMTLSAPNLPARTQPRDEPEQPLRVHAAGDPQRDAVEDFIRGVYAARYGAQVNGFAPVLVSLHEGGQIVAAAGYRNAAQPLFLERYLDEPVEALLARHHGGTAVPAREHIVEVGHLAATKAGEGRRLVLMLGAHLAQRRTQWVVSTLTQELRQLFSRMGLAPVLLGRADPARLGHEAADWGRYYEHQPVVLAGHLPQALHQLALRKRRAHQRGGAMPHTEGLQ